MARLCTLLALLLTLVAPAAPANIFTWQGLEADATVRPRNIDTTTDAEFLPFSKGIHHDGDLTTLDVPPDDPRTNFRYVGLGPFPVQPMHRYRLSFRATITTGNHTILFTATFLKGDVPLIFRPVVNLPPGTWMSDTLVSQDLATPPDADRLILWLGASGNGKPVPPGHKLIIHDVTLIPVGPMAGNPAVVGKAIAQLAPVYDISRAPVGPLAPGTGHFGSPGKEVDVTVADQNGAKVLLLKKEAGDYTYPFARLADLPYDNTWLRFSFRAKGSGRIAAGIWWMRGERTWSYGAGDFVELNDAWQQVTFLRACTDATARGGAVAFHLGSDTLDATIDQLQVTVVTPDPR